MTPQDLQTLLSIRGIRSRVARDEVQIQVCVTCGNEKWNFEINPSRGMYHAWCCGARGRAEYFVRDYLGVTASIPVNITENRLARTVLKASPEVFQELQPGWSTNYLRERGLDTVDTRIYEAGQGAGETWGGRVVFQVRDYWSRSPIGYLGRAVLPGVRPKYFAHWDDGTKHITGYTSRSDIHVVVEGVFDGIRVHQAGLNAAVLGGVSEKQVEEWAARVPQPHTVVVLLDGDAIEQANRLRWRIYPIHEKVILVELPTGVDPAVLERRTIHALIRRKVQC